MTSLHLFELALEERQISIRPSIDDVRDSCSRFAACRAVGRRGDRRRADLFFGIRRKLRLSNFVFFGIAKKLRTRRTAKLIPGN
jgi:hypothetical protein